MQSQQSASDAFSSEDQINNGMSQTEEDYSKGYETLNKIKYKQTKQVKGSNKIKDKHEQYKVKTKDQPKNYTKGQYLNDGQLKKKDVKSLKEQTGSLSSSKNKVKTDLKQQLKVGTNSEYYQNQGIPISEQNLAKLYCQCQGHILQIAFTLKIGSLFTLCKMLLPILTHSLKSLQSLVRKRKLRRIFLCWNQSQLKQFIHKFFQIKNNQLYGYSNKINLTPLYKLIRMKYDTTVTISNDQVLGFYKDCLDLHLSVYQDVENKRGEMDRHMVWTRIELKIFCRLLMQTDNLQKVSDVMVLEFGKLKDKFSPMKLFEKLDILIKMCVSKIKQQCSTFPGLGEIRKMFRHDFYNISYNKAPRYQKIRQDMVQYFEFDIPPLQATHDILAKVNRFLDQERMNQKTQISGKDGLDAMKSRRMDTNDNNGQNNPFDNQQLKSKEENQYLAKQQYQYLDQSRVSSAYDCKLQQGNILGQNNASHQLKRNQRNASQSVLKKIIDLDVSLLSSSDEQIIAEQ